MYTNPGAESRPALGPGAKAGRKDGEGATRGHSGGDGCGFSVIAVTVSQVCVCGRLCINISTHTQSKPSLNHSTDFRSLKPFKCFLSRGFTKACGWVLSPSEAQKGVGLPLAVFWGSPSVTGFRGAGGGRLSSLRTSQMSKRGLPGQIPGRGEETHHLKTLRCTPTTEAASRKPAPGATALLWKPNAPWPTGCRSGGTPAHRRGSDRSH